MTCEQQYHTQGVLVRQRAQHGCTVLRNNIRAKTVKVAETSVVAALPVAAAAAALAASTAALAALTAAPVAVAAALAAVPFAACCLALAHPHALAASQSPSAAPLH